jgi:hypothetical protein
LDGGQPLLSVNDVPKVKVTGRRVLLRDNDRPKEERG